MVNCDGEHRGWSLRYDCPSKPLLWQMQQSVQHRTCTCPLLIMVTVILAGPSSSSAVDAGHSFRASKKPKPTDGALSPSCLVSCHPVCLNLRCFANKNGRGETELARQLCYCLSTCITSQGHDSSKGLSRSRLLSTSGRRLMGGALPWFCHASIMDNRRSLTVFPLTAKSTSWILAPMCALLVPILS